MNSRINGRFCTKKDKDGKPCNAFMIEKSVFWLCPRCQTVEHMPKSMIQAKIQEEQDRFANRGRVVSTRNSFSIDGDDIFSPSSTVKARS